MVPDDVFRETLVIAAMNNATAAVSSPGIQ
jgi:hypothetical protein